MYAPSVGVAKHVNQLITKVKTYLDNNTLILGDFNTALSANDRSSNHKITKETRALSDTLDQMDFTDIYRTLNLNATEYTFFLSLHGTFSRKTTYWVKNQVSTNTKRLGLSPAYFQTTII